MAVTSGSRLQFEFMIGGGSPLLMTLPEANDATGWDQGTPCALDSSGHITKISSGDVSSASNVFCMALSPMSSTADGSESKPFLVITDHTVFSAVVAHATTASALTQATQVGTIMQITNSATICPSTNVYVMEIATTDQCGGYCIGNKDATGTAYGRNYFIWGPGAYSSDSPWWHCST